MNRLIADSSYDASQLRATMRDQGTIPVIIGRRNRKRPIPYDERRYKAADPSDDVVPTQ